MNLCFLILDMILDMCVEYVYIYIYLKGKYLRQSSELVVGFYRFLLAMFSAAVTCSSSN